MSLKCSENVRRQHWSDVTNKLLDENWVFFGVTGGSSGGYIWSQTVTVRLMLAVSLHEISLARRADAAWHSICLLTTGFLSRYTQHKPWARPLNKICHLREDESLSAAGAHRGDSDSFCWFHWRTCWFIHSLNHAVYILSLCILFFLFQDIVTSVRRPLSFEPNRYWRHVLHSRIQTKAL